MQLSAISFGIGNIPQNKNTAKTDLKSGYVGAIENFIRYNSIPPMCSTQITFQENGLATKETRFVRYIPGKGIVPNFQNEETLSGNKNSIVKELLNNNPEITSCTFLVNTNSGEKYINVVKKLDNTVEVSEKNAKTKQNYIKNSYPANTDAKSIIAQELNEYGIANLRQIAITNVAKNIYK